MDRLPSKSWHPVTLFIGIQLITLFIGILLFMTRGTDVWYQALNKPDFMPSGWVFAILWLIFFICVGIAGFYLWKTREEPLGRPAFTLWVVQTVMILIWFYVCFHRRSVGLALLGLLLLSSIIFVLLSLSWRLSKKAFGWLCPYFVGIEFASLLNLMVFMMN